KITESARQLSTTVRHVNESLDEIVWAVNPRNDTVPHLIDFICEFAAEFLQAAGVKCRVDVPTGLPRRIVTPEQRHNLFLSVKEALNNIVRHARADEVWLRFRLDGKTVTVRVEDNGRGLGTEPNHFGADGLRNMRQRMKDLGGECRIENIADGGTRIIFSFPTQALE
ncbi:MAG TPA: ATP-binding protein, partial [Desulfuromonadaceae bacterium]|nr:ATP-binding protein [Desulfuromonadaceae bacterium]